MRPRRHGRWLGVQGIRADRVPPLAIRHSAMTLLVIMGVPGSVVGAVRGVGHPGVSQRGDKRQPLTEACSRRPPVSAALPFPGAAEPQRSASGLRLERRWCVMVWQRFE
jgi:hypothetical protein